MAEIVLAVATFAAEAGTAIASTAASAGSFIASAASSALSAVSVADILQGGMTVLEGISAIGEGQAEADKARFAAREEKMQAVQEEIDGRKRSIELTQSFNERLAQSRVSLAANGVDVGQGVGLQLTQDAMRREGDAQLSNERQFQIRAMARRRQARQLLEQADASEGAGYLSAAGALAKGAFNIANRG